MGIRHIVSALDLVPEELELVFKYAQKQADRKRDFRAPRRKTLEGALIGCLFLESSTRTRFSFLTAIHQLGGAAESMDNAEKFSSLSKGESFEDSIYVMSRYFDTIVLRSPEAGAAERAANVSRVPVINAGDGNNEHPTQAFLDLYTIWERVQVGQLPKEGLHVLFFGDNFHSRTVRSLALLLARRAPRLGIQVSRVTFAGLPDTGRPREDTYRELTDAGIQCVVCGAVPPRDADVVYVTRSQTERHAPEEGTGTLVYTPEYAAALPGHARILHPLPRKDELPIAPAMEQRAWFFQQSDNGVPVRMGLLNLVLGTIDSLLVRHD